MLDGVENSGKDIVIAGTAKLPDDFLQDVTIGGDILRGGALLSMFLCESLKQIPVVREFCN